MSIEEMIREGKTVTFQQYKDGELWYRTTSGFDYPVPMNHQGDAAYLAQDRAMQFMR